MKNDDKDEISPYDDLGCTYGYNYGYGCGTYNFYENELRIAFANDFMLKKEERKMYGHQINQMLLNYSINGLTYYDYEGFTYFYHHFYGNCYTFNSGNCKKDIIKESISKERALGFKLHLSLWSYEE